MLLIFRSDSVEGLHVLLFYSIIMNQILLLLLLHGRLLVSEDRYIGCHYISYWVLEIQQQSAIVVSINYGCGLLSSVALYISNGVRFPIHSLPTNGGARH